MIAARHPILLFSFFCRTNSNSNPHCNVTDLEMRVAMPTNLQKARELFLHAVGKLPEEQWDGYVSGACCGDADLEQQARRWFDQADMQIDRWWRVRPGHEVGQGIWDFRAEAAELLELEKKTN